MIYLPYVEGKNTRALRWSICSVSGIWMMYPFASIIWSLKLAGFLELQPPPWPPPVICLIPDCTNVAEYGTLGNYIVQSIRLGWLAIDWPSVFSAAYGIGVTALALCGVITLGLTWSEMRKTLWPVRAGAEKAKRDFATADPDEKLKHSGHFVISQNGNVIELPADEELKP